MLTIPRLSFAARIAVGVFGMLSLVGACLIAKFTGFNAETGASGSGTTFVSGLPAIGMALIQLAAAWAAFSALLGQYGSKRRAYFLSLLLVAVAPLVILAAK